MNKTKRFKHRSLPRPITGAAAGALVALLCFSGVEADDRNLLRTQSEDPYVFLILDTSGSMNWNVGELELPFLRADSPDSKMYQAKEAVYEVVSGLDDVRFGFSTFNQDQLQVDRKHWVYEAAENGPRLSSGRYYPARGDQHVFGATQGCSNFGCGPGFPFSAFPDVPADIDDEWEGRRMQMYSKGGTFGNDIRSYFIEEDGDRYQVDWGTVDGDYGDSEIEITVRVRGFNNGGYNGYDRSDRITMTIAENSDAGFVSVDLGINRSSPSNPRGRQEFFNYQDSTAGGTCNGWEPNDDSGSDVWDGVNLKMPTDTSESEPLKRYGDVVPLSWENDNKEAILSRLAPNRLFEDTSSAGFEPDFRVARYLENNPINGELNLIDDLEDAGGSVIMPRGNTPLGAALEDFLEWYEGENGDAGWRALASDGDDGDPDWGCRNVYVVLLTDGLETCNSDGPGAATDLRNAGVRTYVIGFGVEGSDAGDDLDEIALAGGTGVPYRPQTVDELVDTLNDLFEEIKPVTTSFSAAAVPAVSVDVDDKVFFSDFTPIDSNLAKETVWPGKIEAYLKPVPLNSDGSIDRERDCAAGEAFACRAWDAGTEVYNQSLTADELDAAAQAGSTADPLGPQTDQRRVYFSPGIDSLSVPDSREFFWADEDSSDSHWKDLLFAFGITSNTPPTDSQKARGFSVLKKALAKRDVTLSLTLPDGTTQEETFNYVLGDSFHSDPVVVDGPDDFFYFAVDYGSNGNACDDESDPNPGYRCFVEKHLYRRKMLMIGSNDGQVHAFDAGVLREESAASDPLRFFDNGTGRELFSYVPRTMTQVIREREEYPSDQSKTHEYGVDGTLVTVDAFMDPSHNGTPAADEREWRSVVIGGLREGGAGYFALDVTQPDKLTRGIDPTNDDGDQRFQNIPEPADGTTSGWLPSCANGDLSGACGPLPFPSMLWEFTDSNDLDGDLFLPEDWDGNGLPDLGDSWSTPTTGLVRVTVNGVAEDRFVAIFGGGIDPDHRENDADGIDVFDDATPSGVDIYDESVTGGIDIVGNWLYMVDIETGQLIYKKRVSGAVPSTISAVDSNRDVYLDTLYFGTTAGLLYKVDIGPLPDGTFPEIDDLLRPEDEAERSLWEPFVFFDTRTSADPLPKPIFYPPAVIYVATKNLFAVAFGTGYREDLWLNVDTNPGKYYMVLDDLSVTAGDAPFQEDDLAPVDPADTSLTNDNLLISNGGWFMTLRLGERQISNTFAQAGIVLFNTYKPDEPDPSSSSDGVNACSRTGQSRFYIVSAINANGYIPEDSDDPDAPEAREKFISLTGFTAVPYIDQLGTKNRPGSDDDPDGSSTTDPASTADELSEAELELLQEIDGQRPAVCRFSNRKKVVKFRLEGRPGTALPYSVCTVQHNWREQ